MEASQASRGLPRGAGSLAERGAAPLGDRRTHRLLEIDARRHHDPRGRAVEPQRMGECACTRTPRGSSPRPCQPRQLRECERVELPTAATLTSVHAVSQEEPHPNSRRLTSFITAYARLAPVAPTLRTRTIARRGAGVSVRPVRRMRSPPSARGKNVHAQQHPPRATAGAQAEGGL